MKNLAVCSVCRASCFLSCQQPRWVKEHQAVFNDPAQPGGRAACSAVQHDWGGFGYWQKEQMLPGHFVQMLLCLAGLSRGSCKHRPGRISPVWAGLRGKRTKGAQPGCGKTASGLVFWGSWFSGLFGTLVVFVVVVLFCFKKAIIILKKKKSWLQSTVLKEGFFVFCFTC